MNVCRDKAAYLDIAFWETYPLRQESLAKVYCLRKQRGLILLQIYADVSVLWLRHKDTKADSSRKVSRAQRLGGTGLPI